MFHAYDGPVDKANHFLDNSFYPDLKHGQLLGYAVDDRVACGHVVKIGLMEHEGIVV